MVVLCVLASLLVPGIASASTAAGAETRVGVFDLPEQAFVGGAASLTLELHRGCELAYDQLASDSLLAARGGAATARELNQIAHVFPRAEKGLEGLVAASGGSELNALRAIQSAANQALAEGRIVAGANGVLPGNGLGAVLEVNGVNVQLIGGRIMNGVVELGSFVGF